MVPQCELIVKHLLPIFRSVLAKELVQIYGLTQIEVAKKLGTTQAAISQYLSSKRAFKSVAYVEKFMPTIQVMANETARKLANRDIDVNDVTLNYCILCSTFCEKSISKSTYPIPEYFI